MGQLIRFAVVNSMSARLLQVGVCWRRRGAIVCVASVLFLFATSPNLWAQSCVPDAFTSCLNGNRFRVEVPSWRQRDGSTGKGMRVSFGSTDTGLFWFFTPENWEVMIKVLNQCDNQGLAGYWVFGTATTDVEYEVRVTDTVTGRSRSYTNPLGQQAAAITDVNAFPAADGSCASNRSSSAGDVPLLLKEVVAFARLYNPDFQFSGSNRIATFALEKEVHRGQASPADTAADPMVRAELSVSSASVGESLPCASGGRVRLIDCQFDPQLGSNESTLSFESCRVPDEAGVADFFDGYRTIDGTVRLAPVTASSVGCFLPEPAMFPYAQLLREFRDLRIVRRYAPDISPISLFKETFVETQKTSSQVVYYGSCRRPAGDFLAGARSTSLLNGTLDRMQTVPCFNSSAPNKLTSESLIEFQNVSVDVRFPTTCDAGLASTRVLGGATKTSGYDFNYDPRTGTSQIFFTPQCTSFFSIPKFDGSTAAQYSNLALRPVDLTERGLRVVVEGGLSVGGAGLSAANRIKGQTLSCRGANYRLRTSPGEEIVFEPDRSCPTAGAIEVANDGGTTVARIRFVATGGVDVTYEGPLSGVSQESFASCESSQILGRSCE